MSFMHGAQDGQKFIGVLFLGLAFSNGQNSVSGMQIPVWMMLLCSIVMAVGTSVGGEKIIKSVGMDMVKLERYQGFSADMAGVFCLLLSSLSEFRFRQPTQRQAPLWESAQLRESPRSISEW